MRLNGNEKILIIKPSAIGDILHALPLLHRIKKCYPETKISWVINREYADLLQDNPLIDKIFIFERKKWGRKGNIFTTISEFYKFTKDIAQNSFDIVIDLQGLLRSGITAVFSGSPVRIGLSGARELSVLSYNHVVSVGDLKLHAVDRYLLVSKHLGIDNASFNGIEFPLFWGDDLEIKIDEFLENSGVSTTDIKVAINPVSRWQSKTWMPDKFAQVADSIMDKFNAKVIFIGGQSDICCFNEISSLMRNKPVSAIGKTTLRESAVLLSKADLLITNDSGPMHMAVAVKTPVVALFGPTDPSKTGPYGKEHRVIQKDMNCRFCFKKKCGHQSCMTMISVDDVINNAEFILKSAIKNK